MFVYNSGCVYFSSLTSSIDGCGRQLRPCSCSSSESIRKGIRRTNSPWGTWQIVLLWGLPLHVFLPQNLTVMSSVVLQRNQFLIHAHYVSVLWSLWLLNKCLLDSPFMNLLTALLPILLILAFQIMPATYCLITCLSTFRYFPILKQYLWGKNKGNNG